jgi:hypothetical protein
MCCRGLEGYRYITEKSVQADSEGHWLEGRINPASLAESQRIWRLVDTSYIPIDWHLDFKSGYRWTEATWYLDAPYAPKPGADIKVPWELARMQHLPQLAWACALAVDGQLGFALPQVYAREFRNQVLDFIATNPPRFGVNWHFAMDVAIRVANWLVAYDLFRGYGAEFDAEFKAYFSRSVYEHGLHIVENLEWHPEVRANHYLADIAGLLFVAAYLPCTPETDAWLAFAVQELVKEVEYQFTPGGANFEASTCYHRLSAEMVTYATALVLGLPLEKQRVLKESKHQLYRALSRHNPASLVFFPVPGSGRLIPFLPWYIERLEKMAEFTMHITKPNGHILQVGDNDSGRFLKLQPVYHQLAVAEAKARYANLSGYTDLRDDAIYWDEDHLDHRHLVAAINGLFGRDDLLTFTGDSWLETALIRRLAGDICLPSYRTPSKPMTAKRVGVGIHDDWTRLTMELDSLPEKHRQVLEIPIPSDDLRKGLQLYAYPDFGLYLYRSIRLYLAVRCGGVGLNVASSHAHNDQLAIELNVDGADWITDPGTYLYTPLPERRNEYRSVSAHSAPRLNRREPVRLSADLFGLANLSRAECLYFGEDGFIGRYQECGTSIYRIVEVGAHGVWIRDYAEGDLSVDGNVALWHTGGTSSPPLSTGYGIRTI